MILIRSIKLNRLNNFRSPLIRLFSNQSTDEKITTNNRKKYNKPPPIDLKSVRTNQQQGEANENSRSSTGKINALALLSIPILTFGLGVWQVKRREEKMKMIKFLEERTKAQPMELPTNPRDLATLLEKHEYQQFKVKGKFLHSKEILLTIRHDMTSTIQMPGGHVITPFLVSGRKDGLVILVNRGFVPYTHYSPTRRLKSQIEDEIEIVGLLRGNELTNTFTPVNNPQNNEWHHRDINQMAFELNTAPIFLDAVYTTPIKDGPIGGQTNVQLRNDHLTYLITWFSLSGLTSLLWWKRYARILF